MSFPVAMLSYCFGKDQYRFQCRCFVSFCFVLFRIVSYRFVSCFVSYRIVSYRIVSFHIVSYRFVSFRFVLTWTDWWFSPLKWPNICVGIENTIVIVTGENFIIGVSCSKLRWIFWFFRFKRFFFLIRMKWMLFLWFCDEQASTVSNVVTSGNVVSCRFANFNWLFVF